MNRIFNVADVVWPCHICREWRPDARISVVTTDLSAEHGLPGGTMKQNVRYCNDRSSCHEAAKVKRLFRSAATQS